MGLLIGGGYAIAVGGGGKVNAYVHRANGDLYIKAKCQGGDRKISWSQVGPRGAAGSGRPGPAGEFATGGGISGSLLAQSANASYPLLDPATGHADGWNAFMNNTGAPPGHFTSM